MQSVRAIVDRLMNPCSEHFALCCASRAFMLAIREVYAVCRLPCVVCRVSYAVEWPKIISPLAGRGRIHRTACFLPFTLFAISYVVFVCVTVLADGRQRGFRGIGGSEGWEVGMAPACGCFRDRQGVRSCSFGRGPRRQTYVRTGSQSPLDAGSSANAHVRVLVSLP